MAGRVVARALLVLAATAGATAAEPASWRGELAQRPLWRLQHMQPGPLAQTLRQCVGGPFHRTAFSIGHRGAPLRYPEHTRESYVAAAGQGAGAVECDVTFTRDRALVCRHSQCDLHRTTNILATPLAARCSQPFVPAAVDQDRPAGARCCTSDITLAEFRTLCGRMDAVDPAAATVAEYLAPGPSAAAGSCGALLTHAESIELFTSLGVAMIPELKVPEVPMPFGTTFTREAYATRLIDEYRAAGVAPAQVRPQSFDLQDVLYWLREHPAFGRQAVFLDGRFDGSAPTPDHPASFEPSMAALAAAGVGTVAPPLWVLLTLDAHGRIVPSAYARAARAAGLDIVTWTLERSGPLTAGGGYYYRSVSDAIDDEGDLYTVLDVLARDVGVSGVFSDWPATVTYYANCRGLGAAGPRRPAGATRAP